MPCFNSTPLRTLADIHRFEAEMPYAQRQPARGVHDLLVATAALHPERLALTLLMTGAADEQPRRVSYRELLGLVNRAANLFAHLGGPRPGVATMLPSLIETEITLWGAETAGYAVPLNFMLQTAHLAELVQASGAKLLVVPGPNPNPQLDLWQKALAVKALLPDLILVRVSAPDADVAGDPADTVDFYSALMEQPADRLVFGEPGRDDEVAAWYHTGGTTGAPKLVAHTHRNQLVAAFGGAAMLRLSEQDVVTNGFPLFHVAGTIACGLACFMAGAEVLLLSPAGFRNPAMIVNFWRIAERYHATIVGGVPTALGAILQVPLAGADLSCVRLGISGAASLPRAIGEHFEHVTGQRLHEILGMTEAAGLVCIDPDGGTAVPGSVGFALPYTRALVLRLNPDASLGAVCAVDEIGVLCISGPTVSPGYRQPEQNRAVFDKGRLNSGDLAFADVDGHIHIAGRSKDLIIRSGHNIDPVMIETAMALHPAVALAAAVAQPDAYAGELPVVYVSLRPGAHASSDELQRHAENTIAERPAWPKQIHVLDSLPLTQIGKIYKPPLRLDAATRRVRQLVLDTVGENTAAASTVEVLEGGKHGLRVTVTLPAAGADAVPALTAALDGFLFESVVRVAA